MVRAGDEAVVAAAPSGMWDSSTEPVSAEDATNAAGRGTPGGAADVDRSFDAEQGDAGWQWAYANDQNLTNYDGKAWVLRRTRLPQSSAEISSRASPVVKGLRQFPANLLDGSFAVRRGGPSRTLHVGRLRLWGTR